MIGYKHCFVVRKGLSSYLGDGIDSSQMFLGSCFKRLFTVNINGYNSNQLYVVAFINKVTTSNMTHEVMNVQQTKLGTNKNFD